VPGAGIIPKPSPLEREGTETIHGRVLNSGSENRAIEKGETNHSVSHNSTRVVEKNLTTTQSLRQDQRWGFRAEMLLHELN
jgi:hypothetical protein